MRQVHLFEIQYELWAKSDETLKASTYCWFNQTFVTRHFPHWSAQKEKNIYFQQEHNKLFHPKIKIKLHENHKYRS